MQINTKGFFGGMNTFFSRAVLAIFVASVFISPVAYAGEYSDSVTQKEQSGVSSALPYSVTTNQYQFTFYPKKAFVQPGQEIVYQLGISNRTASSLPIRFVQVDVYRYMPYGVTGFGTFKADPEVAIQNIEAEDFEVAGSQKKVMTFKIKVPSSAAIGNKKEICLGAMMQSEQNSALNQIANLTACTPIARDAKQISTVQGAFQKVYGVKAQNVDLEYWVPRYLREKMNAKTLESTMIFWKQKQGSTVIPPALITKNDIPTLFKSVYGRTPLASEQKYWEGRLKDKSTKDAMVGAMSFQKSKGKSPKVLGISTIAIKGDRPSIAQGVAASLQLPASSAPSVKIELCTEGKISKCTLIASKASVKTPKITIPSTASVGKAFIKVTARDKKGMVTKTIILKRPVTITKGKNADDGRQFDIKLRTPGGSNLMSRKSTSPVYVIYEDDWTSDEKAYACKIAQWKFDGKDISAGKWMEGKASNGHKYDVFCNGYLDYSKLPSDVHELTFITKTPGGRELSAKAKLNLADD